MKPTINPAAVAAIATAAFLAHNPNYREEPVVQYPERIAEDLLGLNDLIHGQSLEVCDAAVKIFDSAVAFALQVGARIGADPLRLPEIKDLIELYPIPQTTAA